MGFNIGGVAEGAAGGILGAGMGLLLEGHNDRRQLKQEGKLQAQQMAGAKEMAMFNKGLAMDMWEKTGPQGMMAQLKKAGLNPGLMYGMSGAGGGTVNAPQGAGPSTGGAPKGGGEAMGLLGGMAQAGIQTALVQAQKDLIKAQTTTEGVKAGNIAADTGLKAIETGLKQIELEIKDRTVEDQIDIITGEASYKIYAAQREQRANQIDAATAESRIQQAIAESIGATIKNDAMKKGMELNDAQIAQMAQNIAQGWATLTQGDERNAIERYKAEVGELGVIGGIANHAIGSLFGLFTKGKGKGVTNTIEKQVLKFKKK